MVEMTNQTPSPPTKQDANPTLAAHSSLTHIIQDLQDLVFNIALPKTEKAKMVKVPTDTLHLICGLAESAFACISAQGPPSNSNESARLDALDRQMVDIRALGHLHLCHSTLTLTIAASEAHIRRCTCHGQTTPCSK